MDECVDSFQLVQVDECVDTFQLDMACKFAERALEMEPDNTQVLDRLASLLMETSECDRALQISFNLFGVRQTCPVIHNFAETWFTHTTLFGVKFSITVSYKRVGNLGFKLCKLLP